MINQKERQLQRHLIDQIEHVMQSTGVTQAKLARRLRVDPSAVSHWLSGKQRLMLRTILRLATALNLDVQIEIRKNG